jgi:hypothetical protein
MKILWTIFAILLTTAALATAEITITEKLELGKAKENVRAGVQTLCIDGQKFVYAYGWAAIDRIKGVGAGGGVSVIQVYEERGGKVVPAKCK